MISLEKFVSETLGLKARPGEPLPPILALPRFITQDYGLRKVIIEGRPFVVATPADGVEHGAVGFKKHCDILENAFEHPVILELGKISSQQRRRLIDAQQGFVSPGDQLYLPELCTYLREKEKNVVGAALRPNAQLIFFYMLYHPGEGITGPQFALELDLSRMAVSRAGQELEQLGLIERVTEGNALRFQLLDSPREAFEKARPNLRSPVKRRVAISGVGRELPHYISAGLEGLAACSALAPPRYVVRATSDAAYYRDATAPTPDDMDTLELWRYNPEVLASNTHVDPLSLALSIEDMDDPRVAGEVEFMLNNLWENGYKK